MKSHIGVDAQSGLLHTVIGTAANVHDLTAAHALLHGAETDVYADAGYQGVELRREDGTVRWHVAMRPSRRRQLDLSDRLDAIYDQIERLKAGIWAKVEHPFRVFKQQFGFTKTRYRGLMKNTRSSRHCLPCATCGWHAGLCVKPEIAGDGVHALLRMPVVAG